MKMISIGDFAKSAQIMFIKRLCNQLDAKWKHLLQYLMGCYIKELKWKQKLKKHKELTKDTIL